MSNVLRPLSQEELKVIFSEKAIKVIQALQIQSVGAGNYPIDILKPNEWGADMKMLACNETSLAQKFKLTGTNLDDMFETKEFSKYGNAKIYKSKKRLDLRLKPKALYEDNLLIAIPTKEPMKKDIFEIMDNNEKLREHIEDKVKKFLNF